MMNSPRFSNNSSDSDAQNNIGSSKTGLPDLPKYTDESKQSETKVPSPLKTPLNYIENMAEWREAQKKYEEEVYEIQQKLAIILSAYEDKGEELDKFREARTNLDIELQKVMGAIICKLSDHEKSLSEIYAKIDASQSEGEDEEIEEENENNDEESEGENNDTNTESEESDNTELSQWINSQLLDTLKAAGVNIRIVSPDEINNLETDEGEQDEGEDPMHEVSSFLHITMPENKEKYQGLLEPEEIQEIENIYSSIKNHIDKYWDLMYQIRNMDKKISKLEKEEEKISEIYNQGRKEAEKMVENMNDLNETYFLNSHLSQKKVSLDSFVSSPMVEKQIANIIELYKKGQTIPKTILLYGKPNSGKTYAANVLANELGRNMYHIKSYDIFEGGFSDPNSMLDTIFTLVTKKKEPCIIFLDEIEEFAGLDDGGPYKKLVENTIRHHISKIKESSLDIIIIGAISNRNRINPNLLKQDVFSKQIYFNNLPKEKYEELFKKMIKEKHVNLGNDIDVHNLLESIKNPEIDHEYLKKLINIAIDFHQLNSGESDNITLSSKDFNDAIVYMPRYNNNVSQCVGF